MARAWPTHQLSIHEGRRKAGLNMCSMPFRMRWRAQRIGFAQDLYRPFPALADAWASFSYCQTHSAGALLSTYLRVFASSSVA